MKDWLATIKCCFQTDKVLYSRHSRQEMAGEEFGRVVEREVFEAVLGGEVIEEYPADKPYASRLIFGLTKQGRPLHVLCAFAPEDGLAVVITVYQPHPARWDEWRRRVKS